MCIQVSLTVRDCFDLRILLLYLLWLAWKKSKLKEIGWWEPSYNVLKSQIDVIQISY